MTSDVQRRRRLMLIAGGLVLAVAIVALVIALSGGDSTPSKTPASTPATGKTKDGVAGTAEVAAEFKGIPQKFNALGAANAPATLMVFADMQCPFCAEFENTVLPQLIDRYVRPGKVRLVFQPVSILGDDSLTGARWVSAAANQNKMFDFAGLFYRNQGEENSGYVTDSFLAGIAKATPGLDVAKLAADAKGNASVGLLRRAQQAAQAARLDGTPMFLLGPTGGTLRKLQVTSLDAGAFVADLDKLTSR
jgi:protein-disulfide isomerase